MEVLIFPTEEQESEREKIDIESVVQSLIGAIPDAVKVMNMAQYDGIQEYISASAVTDIYYIAYKQIRDRTLVLDLVKRLLMVVSIAAVSEQEIRNALEIQGLCRRRHKYMVFRADFAATLRRHFLKG